MKKIKKLVVCCLLISLLFLCDITFAANTPDVIRAFNLIRHIPVRIVFSQGKWNAAFKPHRTQRSTRPYSLSLDLNNRFFAINQMISNNEHDTFVIQLANLPGFKKVLFVERKMRFKGKYIHRTWFYQFKNNKLNDITRLISPRLTYRNFIKRGFNIRKLRKIKKYLPYLEVILHLVQGKNYLEATLYSLKMEQQAGFKIANMKKISPGASEEQKKIIYELSRYLYYGLILTYNKNKKRFTVSRPKKRPRFER